VSKSYIGLIPDSKRRNKLLKNEGSSAEKKSLICQIGQNSREIGNNF
jgi:hypothetical protein